MVTGQDPVPLEICDGMFIHRENMQNTQEEADVIIIHQLMWIVDSTANDINITVISDDTDVFVLLVHFYHARQLTCHVTLEATSKERKSIDIQATALLHNSIAGQLLAAHALSGCDTVAQCFGICKTKVVKVLQAGHQLLIIGNSIAPLDEVIQESITFMAACYGYVDSYLVC